MSAASHPRLCSVIVPCLGRFAAARRCLAAILRHSRHPWELIAVTRGGRATAAYLSGVRDTGRIRVEVVVAPELKNRRAAWHRGLGAARGEYVALVDSRAIVTDAWLDQLIALAEADPAIGLVAPMSNTAPPPQRVDEISTSDGLDAFAARWRSERRGRWFTAETVGGSCFVLKRGVLEVLGSRARTEAAVCRPDRLGEHVRQAGFRLAVANDLFIYGERRRSEPANLSAAPPSKRRCRVSLTMIVRDEEENLAACLGSAAGLFDEVVVVDTGSTDRTAEIARSFGAHVFDFVWVDDFAAARNAALARATGDYAFWLDADDRLEPLQRDRLQALFDSLDSSDAAYVVRCACDPDAKGGSGMVVDHVRLFPLRQDVRWTYRVHEQILPALRRAGVPVRWSDAMVRHVGYNDPALRRKKLERDQAILASELAERPDDPFVLFNLGQVTLDVGDPRAALGYLQRSLAGSARADSITHKLHALIARVHQLLGEPERALAACAGGLADNPDDAELLFRKGVLHRLQGQADEAEACWRRILTLRRPERFASVDAGIYGHLTRRNLAALAEEQGDRAEAALHWSEVLAERPGDADAARALARLGQAPVRPGGPPP